MSEIKNNLCLINKKINDICELYDRNAQNVNLIAVSKKVASDKILQAIEFGCLNFGENYVTEAQEKWPEIKQKNPKIKLHLIGHLQSNKVAQCLDLFDCIQSLDSEKLALEFKKQIAKKNINSPEFFIQVNIGQEQQKSGIDPLLVQEFVNFAKNECNLNITGLMCIPPNEEEASPYFALLAKLAKECTLPNLSMGMSADFAEAVALGANYVRIGTGVFGAR
jgi:pyridoxal phosphate enzyme (YggS family)